MSDSPGSGAALSITELFVSLSGIISAWTDSVATLGDHLITVTAYLTSYSSVTSTKSYTLTIEDPCISTTLTWTGTINDATFALGNLDSSYIQLPTTDSLPTTINDQVSSSRSGTALCGAISY